MTVNSENLLETKVLNTKTKIRLGFWNVRTMFEAGKLAQVTRELRQYKLNILGVSGTRWTALESLKTSTGETVLFSGREDNNHREGVAIILQSGVEKSLLEWKPISSKIIKARFCGRRTNFSVIQCHVLTNDADDDVEKHFYNTLQAELSKIPNQDLLLITGDMNAKVGTEKNNYEKNGEAWMRSGAIIGDGDRKSWDPCASMIWDNFAIFRTNCAILTSYIRADPRTCRGLSRGCCHVV